MMSIVRVAPFRSVYALRAPQRQAPSFVPALELSETDAVYVIEAALPGLKPEQIEVNVDKNVLTISSAVDQRSERAGWAERRYSSFSRSLTLPRTANPDVVSASLENGVLRLEIAKAAQPQPRKIAVQAAQPVIEAAPVAESQGE
ncbi:MAG: Hsp20/alpha crystallin family protein [Chloroflexales bacterium]|nr:Hsp20/alpha crystallin family protein [Chloroflexales bacterium]